MSKAQLSKNSERNLDFTKDYSGRGNERRVMSNFSVNTAMVQGSREPDHLNRKDMFWVYHEKMKGENINANPLERKRQHMSNGNKLEHREPNAHDTRGYRIG